MSISLAVCFSFTLVIVGSSTNPTSIAEIGQTSTAPLTVPDWVRIWNARITVLLLSTLAALTIYKIFRMNSFVVYLELLGSLVELFFSLANLSGSLTSWSFPEFEKVFLSIMATVQSIAAIGLIGFVMKSSWRAILSALATFVCGTIVYGCLLEAVWMRLAVVILLSIPFVIHKLNRQWPYPYLMNISAASLMTIVNLNLTDRIFTTLAQGQSLPHLLPSMAAGILLIFFLQSAVASAMSNWPAYTIDNRLEPHKCLMGLAIGHSILLGIAYLMTVVYTFYLE